ncbi:MAG: hypothetical protein QF429_02485 [Candidatus Nitrosopelagicus sp.]|jgi:hypothetical protein|nr:hypothetical protein [Candidatus Nitrosopelagicus sp.]|tara:strand:+ start:1203 stop:1655 length:453 start_codon:yes stop_codon:yes gene_type:complete
MDMMNSLDLLNSEFEKLQNIIESITKNSEKMIPDIISLYYQVTMVQTFSKKLSSDIESIETSEQQKFLNKIDEIQKFITENFSKSLHPDILSQLVTSIQNSTDSLKQLGENSEQKTKETIENEALLYKKLRELMSTKEFVEQYEIGLNND